MGTNLIPIIIPPDQAEAVTAFGDEVRFHLGRQHHGNAVTMFSDLTPPGGGPPPHFHVAEDEWWYILEGEAEFFDGAQWIPVGVGGSVFMPRHSLHTFRNAGRQPLKHLIHTAPAGFENFFKKSAAEFQKGGPPDMPRILEIGAESGIYFPTLAPADAAKRGQPALPPAFVQPGQGQVLYAFGEEATFMLAGAHTGGLFTSFINVTLPGGGPPLHVHENEDEWFFVMAGRVSFFGDGKWTETTPGTAVFAPRKSVHTFKNTGDTPARMLIHSSPSGFEKFFAAAAMEFARPGGPDIGRAVQIAASHGIRIVGP